MRRSVLRRWPRSAMEAQIPPHEREAMMEWHALPPGWWALPYEDFLKERRVRMARVVRKGYQRLCGELPVPTAPSEQRALSAPRRQPAGATRALCVLSRGGGGW